MAIADAETAAREDPRAYRTVAILVWAQSVLGAQLPLHFILGGLTGALLAENKGLATLPITLTVMGSMLAAPLMSAFMARAGRRAGFLLGAIAGTTGMWLASHAIAEQSFALFLAASFTLGIYMAGHNLYRFAAADLASPAFRPKAISWVMAGGLAAALLGPEIVTRFQDWLAPVPYAGAYRAMMFLCLAGALPLMALNLPKPEARRADRPSGRPWREIFAERRVVVAMLCAMVSYALMNLMMTSTPLAMVACGFGTGDAAHVVRTHVLAMYAPSFFTGPLILRFGARPIIATGLTCLALAGVIAISGITFIHFSLALALLGVGWNFGFIGATTMLSAAHQPEERAKVQGLNDFLVFGLVTIGSLSSGVLLDAFGWSAVSLAMVPFLTLAAGALVWQIIRERAS